MSFNEWKNYKLGKDVVTKLGDGLHGTPKYDDNGKYYFINGSNLVDGKVVINSNTKKVTKEQFIKYKKDLSERTILLGINGTIGNIALYNNEMCILGKSAAYLNVNDNFDKQFIRYILANDHFQIYIKNNASGTTIKNVGLGLLREYEFLAPNKTTQSKIANVLSSLDDKIELNRQTNQTLETLAQTLFKEMSLPKSEELPDGWRVERLGNVCEVNKNTLNKKTDSLEWIDYIEISEVSKGIVGNVSRYNIGEEPSRAKRKLKNGDVILSTVRPDRGSYFLAINPLNSDIVSTGFAVFSATKVPFSFLYLFLTNENSLKYYGQVANGGTYPTINPNVIMDMELIIPSDDVLIEFNRIVEPILLQFHKNQKEIQTLSALRDSLLPKLMKGEIAL